MELLNFTIEDHERKTQKAKRVKQALKESKKGQRGNVIKLAHVFESKLWENNREAWQKVFDTKRKVD
jgi:hypothetical protein